MKKSPGYDYGIVDEEGYFLWPDKYKLDERKKTL